MSKKYKKVEFPLEIIGDSNGSGFEPGDRVRATGIDNAPYDEYLVTKSLYEVGDSDWEAGKTAYVVPDNLATAEDAYAPMEWVPKVPLHLDSSWMRSVADFLDALGEATEEHDVVIPSFAMNIAGVEGVVDFLWDVAWDPSLPGYVVTGFHES